MSSTTTWQYLGPKEGSAYRQLFVKGTRVMARILYGMIVREEDPMTPEEIAAVFRIPVEAIHEAVAYCQSDPPEIREDWEREEVNIKKRSTETDVSLNSVRPLDHETVP
jgi:hypothetical protein